MDLMVSDNFQSGSDFFFLVKVAKRTATKQLVRKLDEMEDLGCFQSGCRAGCKIEVAWVPLVNDLHQELSVGS